MSSWPVLLLVDDLFHQNLADALRDAAVNLAGQRQGVDDGADVIDDKIGQQFNHAGSGIDLHLADMAAVRIGRLLGGVDGTLDQPRRQSFRQTRRQERGCATCFNVTLRSVPATLNSAFGERDIARSDLHQVRGDQLAFLDDLVSGQNQSGAPGHH